VRTTFQKTLEVLFQSHPDLVLLLGDIGVHSFSKMAQEYPQRIYNVGILEQTMVSLGAGLSKSGLNPILHSIAPFVVERPYEQIKIDFGYQKLRGNIFSVGASYDYSTLGATHHCPSDIALMLLIPGTDILIPGNDKELVGLMNEYVLNNKLSYFRLTENGHGLEGCFSNGEIIKTGKDLTVIAYGPTLNLAIEASKSFDIEIIYFNKVMPFESGVISKNCASDKILILEPFYQYTTTHLVQVAMERNCFVKSIGVPREFIHDYGTFENLDQKLGFNVENIKSNISKMISS
jgi:transketolase